MAPDDDDLEVRYEALDERPGVPDGEGTPAGEATASREYHLDRARRHLERATEHGDGYARIDVLEDLSVVADEDGVQLLAETSERGRRRISRDEALLLAKCLEVALTEGPSRPAVETYRGP